MRNTAALSPAVKIDGKGERGGCRGRRLGGMVMGFEVYTPKTSMKAITIWQPWASLVAIGAKQIETRGWATNYRGPLAIHAGKRFFGYARLKCSIEPFAAALRKAGIKDWTELPLGAVIATCRLVACRPIIEDGGIRTEIPEPERSFGDFAPGRWAWILEDVVRLEKPVAAKGKQGLWEWDGDVA